MTGADSIDRRRVRRATAVACTALLLALGHAPLGASQSAKDESEALRVFVASLEPNIPIDVRLKDGSRLRGRLVRISDQALLVELKGESGSPRSVGFAEIDSVLRRKQRRPLVARIGIGVGIYVASVVIIGALVD
jgi:hypothetical protein